MTNSDSSPGPPGDEKEARHDERPLLDGSLSDREKIALHDFIQNHYKLSAVALTILAFGLGFFLRDLALKSALLDAGKQASESVQKLEDYLRPQGNSHLSIMARAEATHENLQAIERELQSLLNTLDLDEAARVLQSSAGEILKPPHFTQVGPLDQGETDLGEHTLCFLMTVEIDAKEAQTCTVFQRGTRWIGSVDSMTCHVGCLDLM